MRKLVPLALITVLVLTLAGPAWAAGGAAASPAAGAAQQRVEQFRQAMEQLKAKLQTMSQNRIRIREMQGEVKGLAAQIRAEVRRIREAGLPFTEEQVEEIKGVTAEMRGFGKSIAETIGQITQQAGLMRQARGALESEPVRNAYNRMQAVQEARLAHLDNLIKAMNALLARLQAIQ